MKTLITTIALSIALVFSAQAQDTKKMDKRVDTQSSVKEQPPQDAMAQAKKQTEAMVRDLNLTADQSKKVMKENQKLYADISSLKARDVEGEKMDAMMNKSVDAYDKAMKNVLKKEQYKRFSSMKSDYVKQMKNDVSNMAEEDMQKRK